MKRVKRQPEPWREAKAAVRASLGRFTSEELIAIAADVLVCPERVDPALVRTLAIFTLTYEVHLRNQKL